MLRMKCQSKLYYTTKLSPSCFLPVCLKYETMRCPTPTILATFSISDDMFSSPVMMARRRKERHINQLRSLTHFRVAAKNSVKQKASELLKTDGDTFCRQSYNNLRSKMGYSTGFVCTHFTDSSHSSQPVQANLQKKQLLKNSHQ